MSGIVIGTWENTIPVMLPYGGVTMAGIVPASFGVCVPFTLFMIAMFSFMYNEHWSKQHATQLGDQQMQAEGYATSRRSSSRYPDFYDLVVVGGGG